MSTSTRIGSGMDPDEGGRTLFNTMLALVPELTVDQLKTLLIVVNTNITEKTWGQPLWNPSQGDSEARP